MYVFDSNPGIWCIKLVCIDSQILYIHTRHFILERNFNWPIERDVTGVVFSDELRSKSRSSTQSYHDTGRGTFNVLSHILQYSCPTYHYLSPCDASCHVQLLPRQRYNRTPSFFYTASIPYLRS